MSGARGQPPRPPAAHLAAHLEQELQLLAGGLAGQLVGRGEVQGIEPGGPAAHFAGEAVPQQVSRLLRRLHKAQVPLPDELLLLRVAVMRAGMRGLLHGGWKPCASWYCNKRQFASGRAQVTREAAPPNMKCLLRL